MADNASQDSAAFELTTDTTNQPTGYDSEDSDRYVGFQDESRRVSLNLDDSTRAEYDQLTQTAAELLTARL